MTASLLQPQRKVALAVLAALAVLSYLPIFFQPFISDDFVNILKADHYVPPSGWRDLLADPIHLYRPVFLLPTYLILHVFGPWPPAFYAFSLLLHVFATWLVYALGGWKPIGRKPAFVAAAFFAVYEGHQEAVMWYSASYELYQAIFLLLAFLCWVRWLQQPAPAWRLYIVALASFVLGLASKESAAILPALLALPPLFDRSLRRRAASGLAPFLLIGGAHAWWVLRGGGHYSRLDDGSFSLGPSFAFTWLNSYGRMLWFWGAAAGLTLIFSRDRRWARLTALAGLWIGISLVPYSFLTYMNRVPSRHTYLASVGLAWLVAAGLLCLAPYRRLVALTATAVVLHNVSYLWIWKRPQYLLRAEATQALISLARRSSGPVYVHKFPFLPVVAHEAVYLCAGKPRDSVVILPSAEPALGLEDYSYSLDGVHPTVYGVRLRSLTLGRESAGRSHAKR